MPDNAEFMEELLNRQPAEPMRAALVAIQELHIPVKGWISEREYLLYCADCGDATYPCKTRKLADEALTDRMARTNQGETK